MATYLNSTDFLLQLDQEGYWLDTLHERKIGLLLTGGILLVLMMIGVCLICCASTGENAVEPDDRSHVLPAAMQDHEMQFLNDEAEQDEGIEEDVADTD